MSELDKALEYAQQELNKKFGGKALSEEDACDEIYDCMEQYGEDNDLPEGWWMETSTTSSSCFKSALLKSNKSN